MDTTPLPSQRTAPTIEPMPDGPYNQLAALVALLKRPGARWQEITADAVSEGSALAVLERLLGAGETLFSDLEAVEDALRAAQQEIDVWRAEGIDVHSLFDDSYPAPLRDIHQMPPIVFTRGTLADDRRAVAVVGTRKPTPDGVAIADAIATALAESGVTVVSGLAQGIDTAAHTAALRAGGRTVAVIGTGINRYYPAANKALQQRIIDEGLVLSQFWPDAPPTKHSFPMRNAVMSGYAAATVVVEAAYQSGARMQARLALQHGRPVVLTRALMHHDWAQEYARRPGVYVVGDEEELIGTVEHIVRQIPGSEDPFEGLPRLVHQ
jgi:DNA processing protein